MKHMNKNITVDENLIESSKLRIHCLVVKYWSVGDVYCWQL